MTQRRGKYPPASREKNGLVTDQLEVIARAGTAAFATDENGYITVWNRGAEELLGYPADRVLGKSCHEILCGIDLFGNLYCSPQCPVKCMAKRHEAVRHFEMDVRAESGHMIPAGFSILVLAGARAGQHAVIHFMERVDRKQEVSALIHRIMAEGPGHAEPARHAPVGPATSASQPQLTSREIQVLRLLAEGISTEDIASSLFISVLTTRNHVQNILRKLAVHSKLEAVSLALRTNLL